MIKLGTENEIDKVKHLPENVRDSIYSDVSSLDCFYGKDRNIDTDMGGFVIVCDANETLHIENFTEDINKAEYIQTIFPYCKALYISGAERNIIIYRKIDANGQM